MQRGAFDKAKPLGEMSAVERENAWDALFDSLDDTGDAEFDALFARERRIERKIAHLADEIDAPRGDLEDGDSTTPQRDQIERRVTALSRYLATLQGEAEKLQDQRALLENDE